MPWRPFLNFFHVDIAEVKTEEGKLFLWVAIDRTSKYAFAQLHERADRLVACAFLQALINACPYRLHTILTDNGIQFAELLKNRVGPTAKYRVNRFDQICRKRGIKDRLTKPNHPWTNGQVERMDRTLKDATFKRYSYANHDQPRNHVAAFLAYNLARSSRHYVATHHTRQSAKHGLTTRTASDTIQAISLRD